jgi:hypothetical protein
VCVNICIEICYILSNKHTVRFAYDQHGYIYRELRLEPKFRKVVQARFRFSSNEDPVISNFDDLLYTIETTAEPISTYTVGVYQIMENATPRRKCRRVE